VLLIQRLLQKKKRRIQDLDKFIMAGREDCPPSSRAIQMKRGCSYRGLVLLDLWLWLRLVWILTSSLHYVTVEVLVSEEEEEQ